MAVQFVTTIAGARSTSYVTLEEANQYFENRPESDVWTAATDDQKKQALNKSTLDVERERYKGYKWRMNQNLEFPRSKRRGDVDAIFSGRMALEHRQEVLIVYPQSVAGDLASAVISELLETSSIPHFPADFFEGGEVQIISGTGVDEVRRISASSPRTGTLTFASAFSAIDTTSELLIFGPLPLALRHAVCEQAIFRLTNDGKKVTDFINQGLTSLKVGNTTETYGGNRGKVLCREAWDHLSTLISRTGRIT